MTLSSDVVSILLRSGLIRVAQSPTTPFDNGKLIWHDKSAYLKPGMYARILSLLKEVIMGQDMKVDYFVGSYTGGIPWASLLAQEFNIPVCIEDNGSFYNFTTYYALNLNQLMECDYVVANIFGLPMAAYAIRDIQKPLLYIKPGPSEDKFELEGYWEKGKRACFYEAYTEKMKICTAQYSDLLNESGLSVIYGSGQPKVESVNLNNKNVLIIDDIYNSGSGSLKNLDSIRKAGGKVTNVISLFNQQTQEGKLCAKKNAVHIHSIVNTAQIIEITALLGLIHHDEQSAYIEAICGVTVPVL